LIPTVINEREHRRFVLLVRVSRGLRALLPITVAAFLPDRDIEFIDHDRANKIDGWCVKQFARIVDPPPNRPVRNVNFRV